MNRNYVFKSINEALPSLMGDLLEIGDEITSRNGVVKELTHVGITLEQPWQREIVVPDRKANIAAQIAETAWVLAGRDDIEFLSHYLPRAKDFSDDGETWRGAYGPRLRAWRLFNGDMVDQVDHVVDLLRRDPSSRQAVISIYDPAIDTAPGKDIPCNNWITFSSRLGKLDMHVGIRSNDIMWGWSGINAFEWSVLQEIVAGMVGVKVGRLHFSTTSLHLYGQHWQKADRIAGSVDIQHPTLQDSPRFNATGMDDTISLDTMLDHWFTIEEAIRTGSATMKVPPYLGQDTVRTQAAIDQFPEPMFQSWLRVLQWWWTGDHSYLKPLAGTRLEYATHVSLQPRNIRSVETTDRQKFIRAAIDLHNEKHAAYGDSWKRRGEQLGILANIARKIDRLGGAETADETSADTAMDLMIYLAKYRAWLKDQEDGGRRSDGTDEANATLEEFDSLRGAFKTNSSSTAELQEYLRGNFDGRGGLAQMSSPHEKLACVNRMLRASNILAERLWANDPVHGPVEDGADQYRGADVD